LEENKISEQNLNNRKEFAKDIAKQTGAITVLKGNHTVIATPSGLTSIDRIGGVELAKAGTGDILAGLISGFLATWKPQNEKEVFRVVSRAVKVHSQAGRYAKSRYKYPTTTQILNALPKIYRA
jgi:ADP-dependent NAD(P)H-hydrate dehydratase / NAD(P)H-hydrate epimerase